MRGRIATALILALACLSGSGEILRAEVLTKGRWLLSLQAGARQAALNNYGQPWVISRAYGIAAGYGVGTETMLLLEYDYSKVYNDLRSKHIFKIGREHATQYWRNHSVRAKVRRSFLDYPSLLPYLTAGVGLSFWTINDLATEQALTVTDKLDKPVAYKATELILSFGVGYDYFVADNLALNAEGQFNILTGWGEQFSKETNRRRSKGYGDLKLGVTVYLNRGAKPITVIDHLKSEHEATAKPAPDADLDGVPDDADRCPHTPAAARGLVDPRGCPLDSDRDGLADYLDRCPEQFADIRVDSNGCPADFDQDGITDDQDHCPRTPLGYPVDRSGCPELKRIFARVILHPQAAEGGHLDQATESAVAQLISKLRDFPDVQVRIGGYTDNSQASELSRARAERQALLIRDFLVAHNVAIERIQCEGRGAIGFVDTNTTPEGRANNERVEIDFSF